MGVRESSPGRGSTTYDTTTVYTRLSALEKEVGTTQVLSGLQTTNKNSIVDAVNEVLGDVQANNSQLASNVTKVKTISLNLQDYGDFSTLADLADITTIVQSAMKDLINKIDGTTGWKRLKVSVFIPGGRWTISQKRVFDLSQYGSVSAIRGFNVYGAGCENTEIVFNNNVSDTDNYLFYNYDLYGYSEIANIRLTSQNGTEKCFYYYSTSAGNAQSITYRNVILTGFAEGIRYDGTIMTSEMDYYSIKVEQVPASGVGIVVNNNNSLNHNFYACEFENISGVGIRIDAGGCCNFFGGSYISADGGTVFKTTDTSGSHVGTNTNNFNFYGIRTEMNGTGLLFDIANNVNLLFSGCNLTVEKSGVGNSRGIVGPYSSNVSFISCHSRYHYQVRVDNSSYYNGSCRMRFLDCTLADLISNYVTLSGSTSNIAGYPVIESNFTRPIATTGNSAKPVYDESLYKTQTNMSPSVPVKSLFLRTGADGNGGLPANGTTTFTLPLNAIITKVRIVHNVSTLSGTFTYTVQSNDGTPVVFATMSSVANTAAQNAISSDLWYHVSSSTLQTINLVQSGTNSTQNGYIVIDYI